MIEIELFHRDPAVKNQTIKIWINGNLIYANEIATPNELLMWRDALQSELIWVNSYLKEKGITHEEPI